MTPDLALVIRTGSGVLWALLGAWLAWRNKEHRALGVVLFFWGANFVVNNLFTDDNGAPYPWPYARALIALFTLASAGALAFVLGRWARADGRRAIVPLTGVALALVALAFVAFVPGTRVSDASVGNLAASGLPPWLVAFFGAMNQIGAPGTTLAVYASLRLATGAPGTSVREGAAFALAFGLYNMYATFANIVQPGATPEAEAAGIGWALVLAAMLAGSWLVVALRERSPLANVTLNALVASALLGLVVPYAARVPAALVVIDPTGMRGVLRTLGWAIFLVAILRWGILGEDSKPRNVQRGTLAAGALALIFIVAQVAQNFFSAEYGLLTGGIVAGAFLFAASPLQRAAERISSGREARRDAPEDPNAARARPTGERENAYRQAVRLAFKDRVFTREEERHLLRLAYHLAIPTPRAMEIHDEIEREARP